MKKRSAGDPMPTKALQWPSVSFLEVCVAFQYASVMGGLLIMLFSAFVCSGGPIQHCIDRQVLMDIEQTQYPQLHHASCRIPADWLLLLKNWGPWPTCDRSKNNYKMQGRHAEQHLSQDPREVTLI